MSDEKTIQLYNGWLLVRKTPTAGIERSEIMDSDGDFIYDACRMITEQEATMFCRGFEYGFSRGKSKGDLDAKSAIKRAIGL